VQKDCVQQQSPAQNHADMHLHDGCLRGKPPLAPGAVDSVATLTANIAKLNTARRRPRSKGHQIPLLQASDPGAVRAVHALRDDQSQYGANGNNHHQYLNTAERTRHQASICNRQDVALIEPHLAEFACRQQPAAAEQAHQL
jgi:hypothetical protein